MTRTIVVILALSLFSPPVRADVTLARIFSNEAVLQRDRVLPIWGSADPGEIVSVSLGEQQAECLVDERGHWIVELPAQPAARNPLILRVSSGSNRIERTGILLGDVWHASGQSNMGMNVAAVATSLDEVKQLLATYQLPDIRFLRSAAGPSTVPLDEFDEQATWTKCDPDSVTSFSAAAFFFAKKLYEELGVPIGIIDSSRGGTPIEPYIPRSSFMGHPTLVRELELGDKEDLDGIWRLPGGVRARNENWLPSRLFNSRVSPISRFAIRGCIWYQGESNCGQREDPRDYAVKMRALIRGWRAELGRDELPFYFVQLPGSGAGNNWPYLREQQRLCCDIEKSGMVVTIDLEDPDIHPPNKVDVGERLASWALAREYGLHVPYSGPLFSEAQFLEHQAIVQFKHSESGLMIARKRGLAPAVEEANDKLRHFELLGKDGKWMAADATIENNRVIVESTSVNQPIAVRYAYDVAPVGCNLFNRDGFPASPFCSHPELLVNDPDLPK